MRQTPSRTKRGIEMGRVAVESLIKEPVKEAVKEALDEAQQHREETAEHSASESTSTKRRFVRPGVIVPLVGLVVGGLYLKRRRDTNDTGSSERAEPTEENTTSSEPKTQSRVGLDEVEKDESVERGADEEVAST